MAGAFIKTYLLRRRGLSQLQTRSETITSSTSYARAQMRASKDQRSRLSNRPISTC